VKPYDDAPTGPWDAVVVRRTSRDDDAATVCRLNFHGFLVDGDDLAPEVVSVDGRPLWLIGDLLSVYARRRAESPDGDPFFGCQEHHAPPS
jgi:hypothetical protein